MVGFNRFTQGTWRTLMAPDDGAGDGGGSAEESSTAEAEGSAEESSTAEAASLTEPPSEEAAETEASNSEESAGEESLTAGKTDADSSTDEAAENSDEEGEQEKPDTEPAEVEPYEAFTVPEGETLDEKAVEHFTPVLREIGVKDQAQAQKVVDSFREFKNAEVERNIRDMEVQRTRDVEIVRNDEKLGGGGDEDTFNRTMSYVNRALAVGEGAEMNKLMRQHGIDNDPVFVKFLSTVGVNFSEDVIVTTRNSGGGSDVSSIDAAFPTTAT